MEDQVPGAWQDGASQDTAAQAAADGGEQHPGATIFKTQAARPAVRRATAGISATLAPTPRPAHHPGELLAAVSDRPQQLIFEVFPHTPTFIGEQPWKCK